jgi:CheY-like chemotaxis protein
MPEKILVAEDSLFMRGVIKGLLEASHYKVYEVGDGKAAFEMAKEIHPDLILLDVEMPVINGFEAAKRIRTIPKLNNTPILFLTSRSESEFRQLGYEVGGDDYISKPFEPEEMMARVQRQIAKTKGWKETEAQARVETLSQLMVTIAHHINNALAVMKGRAEFLSVEDEEQLESFKKAFKKQSKRIEAVVKSLMEMADQGKILSASYISDDSKMLDITTRLEEKMSEKD